MKQLLLTAFLITFYLFTIAQKKDTIVLNPSGFEIVKKITLPFSTVKITDARFDRSNIGCMHRKVKSNLVSERVPVLLPDSFHLFMPGVIENIVTYQPKRDTLVILFKQFRIVEHLVNNQNQVYEPQLLVKVSASFFRSKNDSLVRIFSFDDLISVEMPIDRNPTKEVVEEFRKSAFIKAFQTLLERKNWEGKGPAFAKKSAEEALQKRFLLPFLTDDILKTGVYKTFKEFKANNPSVNDIKVKMKKGVPVEITDATGEKIDIKGCWGVCTQNKRFIVFREKLYELMPSDKSFRFLSYSQTDDLFGRASFGESLLFDKPLGVNVVNRQYFYLNMDEEEIYLEEIFGKSGLKEIQKDLLK